MGMGDDLMLVGEARERRRTDPRKVAARHGRQARGHRVSPIFINNPHMATPAEISGGDVQWLDEQAGRRYRALESKERRLWTEVGPIRGDLFFQPSELAFANAVGASHAIVIEPNLKLQATPNKDWGFNRWQALVDLAPRLPWLQLGAAGVRQLRGVRFVATPDFRTAAAVMTAADAAVLPEGGLHHAAAAIGLPAVVIFGGYIGPNQTGYAAHVNLTGAEKPCGWRVPCDHCAAAMAAITPDKVFAALHGLLAARRSRVSA